MDIEEFYSADERRRASEEIELGTDWYDASGSRYEVSWVVDTGELYVMLEPGDAGLVEDPFGGIYELGQARTDQLIVGIVGWIPERARLDEVVAGWQEEMGKKNGIEWLASRLEQARVAKSAPA
ncbi:MAG: hypothetical protein WAM97_12960 [Acidimicrobiales bacterium]